MKSSNIISILIVAVIVGAASFYGGVYYQKQQANNEKGNFIAENGGMGGPMKMKEGTMGDRPMIKTLDSKHMAGEIISKDDKSITVKMPDGSTKIVLLSEKTVINKAAAGTIADLKTGEKVVVLGDESSDGAITAQNVQLNPMMRMERSQ